MSSEYQHENELHMKSSETKFINRPCSYITWNCQISLNKKKLFQIETLVEKFDPIIIFIQECNIKENYNTELLKIKGYKIELSQTMQQYGKARVLANVKNNVNTTRQITLDDNENEIIVIDHKHQNGITRVQGVYRPFTSAVGNSSIPDQERRILKLLTNIGNNILNDGTNIILGDFNVNGLSQNHHFSEIMSNFESEFGLDQIIFQITRQRQTNSLKDGQRHEESCIDLVFVDDV